MEVTEEFEDYYEVFHILYIFHLKNQKIKSWNYEVY